MHGQGGKLCYFAHKYDIFIPPCMFVTHLRAYSELLFCPVKGGKKDLTLALLEQWILAQL